MLGEAGELRWLYNHYEAPLLPNSSMPNLRAELPADDAAHRQQARAEKQQGGWFRCHCRGSCLRDN